MVTPLEVETRVLMSLSTELHLYQYFEAQREYLELFKTYNQPPDDSTQKVLATPKRMPKPFSTPDDNKGYNDGWISNDTVTEVYLHFSDHCRQMESSLYLRTRSGSSTYMYLIAAPRTLTDHLY